MNFVQWIDRMERRLGWLTIPNLALFLIALQAMGWVLLNSKPEVAELLVLEPAAVFAGQWWRIFTFLVVPFSPGFWVIFYFWFLYFVLGSLRGIWGDYRLTIYFLVGWIGTVAASLAMDVRADSFFYSSWSFFLALCTLIPEMEVLVFFVLPVRMKWLGLLTGVLFYAPPAFAQDSGFRLFLFASVLNYLLFFGPDFVHALQMEMRRRSKLGP